MSKIGTAMDRHVLQKEPTVLDRESRDVVLSVNDADAAAAIIKDTSCQGSPIVINEREKEE